MINLGSSLNIIPLSTLWVVGVPQDGIIVQPMEVSGFGGNAMYTLAFINFNLTVGPMRTGTRFNIIDAHTLYHLLLERPWIHRHNRSPVSEGHLERKESSHQRLCITF